jgi:hypothetical protein
LLKKLSVRAGNREQGTGNREQRRGYREHRKKDRIDTY